MTSPAAASPVLQAALHYLEDEWSVFPVCTPVQGKGKRCQQHGACKHPGKSPLVKWGTYQDRLAERGEVEQWWHRWPTANIGMATGELSDVVVVDLDGDLAMAEAERRGYEAGPWVRTGRVGGRHLYFRYRKDAPTIFSKIGGIDFRGQGGFVLLPPSLHWSGSRYHWGEAYRRGDPLPILPRWIDELATTGEDGAPRGKVDFGKLLSDGLAEGQRDQELFRAAAKLRGADVPYDLAVRLIELAAAECKPPFDADEARQKVDSAYGRYQPNVVQPLNGYHHWTGAELAGARFDPPRWAIPGILPSGLTILAGRPKMGKSWLALGWSLDIPRGAPVMGKVTATVGSTLYLALEDGPRRMQERMAMMLGEEQWPATIDIYTEWRRVDDGGLNDLEVYLSDHTETRLVVIDTFKRIRPVEKGNQRLYDLDYDAIAPLAALARRHNVAVVVVFHTRKGESSDPLEMVSGTLGLSGAADCVIVLRRERGHADASLFITGRDVEEQDLALRWEKEDVLAWTLIGAAAQFRISQARQEILEVLATLGQGRPADIADALGKNRHAVRQLLFTMTRDGELRCRDSLYSLPDTSFSKSASRNDADITAHTLRPSSAIVSDISTVSSVSTVTGSGKNTCRACGGELSPAEAAARYQLHFDCALPGGDKPA